MLTPLSATTWLSVDGTISCTCVGRTTHVGWLRGERDHAACAHSSTFKDTITRLSHRMGISSAWFRRNIPQLFQSYEPSDVPSSISTIPAENWASEGPVGNFRTGQSAVAVVLSGLGRFKFVALVRCTRAATSCCFCDSAAGFSCVHATRSRGVRRGEASRASGATEKDDEDMDGARSREPIPLDNVPMSVRINSDVCSSMRHGKHYELKAPKCCPMCDMAKNRCAIQSETGITMCSEGYCGTLLASFWHSSPGCQTRVFPVGRSEVLVLWTSSTAATAVILRDMAGEMTTSGSKFNACYRHWNNKYVDLRDSGVFPAMADLKVRSRKTIAAVLFWGLQLMTKDPTVWAFPCSTCQEKDRRYRVVTADGIWLGYLKRLASGLHTNPAEACSSVKATVESASVHPSEWVRRFLRTALKQPSKVVVVKNGQLRSALRALAFLSPDVLPSVTENEKTAERGCR